jgi:hypothetical protein
MALRDCLAHFKWTEPPPKKVMRHLEASKLAMQNKDLNWSNAALTNLTARWAVATVRAMFARLTKMIGRETDPHFSWGNPAAFRPWEPGAIDPCPAVHSVPLTSRRAAKVTKAE